MVSKLKAYKNKASALDDAFFIFQQLKRLAYSNLS